MKSLFDISWQVTEPEYRADSALSYSTLSRYLKVGFNGLDNLFDKIESPSLTFGSAVDAIITGGVEEFDKNFMVADFPSISDSLVTIANTLYALFGSTKTPFSAIPDATMAQVGKECNFYAGDSYVNTRIKKIKEGCAEYYSLLLKAGDKKVVNQEFKQDVDASVSALKTSNATKVYFEDNNPFNPNIQHYYQLKFKQVLNGVEYRCMADEIIVDYENKVIYPIDLKTSSHQEWEFFKSFIDWNYQIQARLYWRIIRATLDKDEFFKDFKLANYRFIVVNRKTLNPLVWEFNQTQEKGTLKVGKDKQIELLDPEEIGKELYGYLSERPIVPTGIEKVKRNDLSTWLNTL